MVDLTRHSELIIRQQREMLEVFTPIETANRYTVHTADGVQILYAYEDSGAMSRQFMGTHRPLSIHVVDPDNRHVLEASRDFFWLLSHLRVSADGRHIGTLNRQAFIGRKFALVDGSEASLAQISGSIFRPWTFIAKDAQSNEIARINKKWSGLGREMFTDADTFQVAFTDNSTDQDFRLLMLATAFSIDLDFFEQKG